jgi:hypothetical protein
MAMNVPVILHGSVGRYSKQYAGDNMTRNESWVVQDESVGANRRFWILPLCVCANIYL